MTKFEKARDSIWQDIETKYKNRYGVLPTSIEIEVLVLIDHIAKLEAHIDNLDRRFELETK